MPLLGMFVSRDSLHDGGRRRLPLVLRSAEGGVALRQSITPRRIVARAREISRRSCELEELGRWQEREGPTPGQGEWSRNPPPARNAVKNEVRWGQFGGSSRQTTGIWGSAEFENAVSPLESVSAAGSTPRRFRQPSLACT